VKMVSSVEEPRGVSTTYLALGILESIRFSQIIQVHGQAVPIMAGEPPEQRVARVAWICDLHACRGSLASQSSKWGSIHTRRPHGRGAIQTYKIEPIEIQFACQSPLTIYLWCFLRK
jgi:hypothetical protein